MKKKKNYKRRSKVYKRLGTSSIFVSSLGGFVAYEASIDWSNFVQEMQNFILINQETVKINVAVAFPLLISFLVFIFVYRKKNAEALKGKVSMNLLFGVILLWLIYSTIEVTLFSMIGALSGSLIDEMVFTPLSNSAKIKATDDHEVELEVRKERVRKKVREELDGTV